MSRLEAIKYNGMNMEAVANFLEIDELDREIDEGWIEFKTALGIIRVQAGEYVCKRVKTEIFTLSEEAYQGYRIKEIKDAH